MTYYLFFHLNLMFSSIEEDQRPEVIRRCYWPILRLARRGVPVGVEASGITLEIIEALDPGWIEELKRLLRARKAEFIGSGYAQLIGPLVPENVNRANLRLGNEAYARILGVRPRLALVNEQAFSAGLVPLYLEAGHEALIMEWNNPAQAHPEWDPEWKFVPQRAAGTCGTTIPILWNESIAFQKFQRFVHGDLELEEYSAWLEGLAGPGNWFPLYGGDAEIFDFRPGRFAAEPELVSGDAEWGRMDLLLDQLKGRMALPSAALAATTRRVLDLTSAAQPVPVKKQGKYNLLRWGVTGRADLEVNTRCHRIAAAMAGAEAAVGAPTAAPGLAPAAPTAAPAFAPAAPTAADWAELCYLWSSDFRTHITEDRWEAYQARLRAMESRWSAGRPTPASRWSADLRTAASGRSAGTPPPAPALRESEAKPQIERVGRYLSVTTPSLELRLNCRRGLALDRAGRPGGPSLVGTLPHGYFHEIELGADFYTGHVVMEQPGRHKTTDLQPVEPLIETTDSRIRIAATIPFGRGRVHKVWTLHADGSLALDYTIRPESQGPSSVRLGHITLNPEAFHGDSLSYVSRNGSLDPETFPIAQAFDHGRSVSGLVSAAAATDAARIELGDRHQRLIIETDQTQSALLGLISYRPSRDGYFLRLSLTAREIDDTLRGDGPKEIRARIKLVLGQI